ncbi:PREDICTED: gramicidin S synthase 2-like [Polistes canadensis]|uniref:gramicidin S synthase 2-like n=1 Tax=Polistes canadensis TaxID=91411 RepID=UPI000718DBCD|nr:PREDICTED: gramicidin S synthase 2-like [Polistes canadensis]
MNNQSSTSDRDFVIEDNILIGKNVPFSTKYTNIGKLLLDKMKAKPDFVGQINVITEEAYTFSKMYDYTVKCALWLRQQGIKRNDFVALCTPITMDSFAPFFATFCVGAIFTPWNPAMDIRETRYYMKLSGAKIVFADEKSVDTILEAAKLESHDIKIVVFGESSNALSYSKILDSYSKLDVNNFECTPIDDVHDSAALLYSSGTTGPPKAVLISHFAFLYNVILPNGFNVEGIPLWFSQYFWITGVLLTLSGISKYCVKLLYPKFEEEAACKIIEKYKVTWVFMSPSMVNRILKSGYCQKYDMSSLTKAVIGGTPLSFKSETRLKECLPNANIIQHYGLTEISILVTTTKPNHKAGSVGTIMKNIQIKIIDLETGKSLGPNKTGEILVKSITIMNGYYNNPQANKDAIDADGWFHTGDLAYYDEDGEIFIIDRLKETIKYQGIQISPWEIESFLLTHADVVDVAVVGVPHLEDDEHPIAFVTKVPNSKVTERELQEFVARNMTDKFHLRAGVKFLEKMPYTVSGKIAKKDLKLNAKTQCNIIVSAYPIQSLQPAASMVNISNTSDRDFVIKDNILIGKNVPFSTEYTNIGQLLLDKMKARPDFVGQINVITEEAYTFSKMYNYTVKCALWLRQQGIKRNDVVALCTPITMDSFAPFFATFCVGAIFTPWNPTMDIRETRYYMKLSGAKIVFADEKSVDTILEAAKLENHDIKIVVFGESSNALSYSKILDSYSKLDVNNFECTPIDDVHDSAALLYSSGTTGPPKAVLISHFAFLYNVILPYGLNAEGIPLWFSQYFWITGVLLTLSGISKYCVKLLYPKFEEEAACKIIEKYKVIWVFMSPSMVNRILKSGYFKKYDVSSIKKLNISGNIFTKQSEYEVKECIPNADIIQMFGMTELGTIVSATKPNHKAGSIGTVLENSQIKIIDLETGKLLGPNKKGEMLAKSITIMNGYYNNPQANKDAIDADGWLHTGDLAYYNENGEIFIMGRLKETMKYQGNQISPNEIENLLFTHPDVVDVAVVGVPHREDDEHPIAFVTKVPNSKVTERELQEFVARNMTDKFHLRAGVKFLENMPYTASGKIARNNLKALAKNFQTN